MKSRVSLQDVQQTVRVARWGFVYSLQFTIIKYFANELGYSASKLKPMSRIASFAILIAFFTLGAGAQDGTSKITGEADRLQNSVKEGGQGQMAELAKNINGLATDTKTAVKAGRTYLGLETLGRAYDLAGGLYEAQEKDAAAGNSLSAFESEWGKVNLELTALDEKARGRDWSKSPAAVRALAETAQGRTLTLMEGGRGFATATKPSDGLFYVGEARGEADFSAFLYKLGTSRPGAAVRLRSVLPEIEALQGKTNAAFQPPRSIEMHPRFIALNSTLKFARELDSARDYAGALYMYLEAVRHYGMLEATAAEGEKQARLRNTLNEELNKNSASRNDDSILRIFLERVSGYLNKPEGEAPTGDEWKATQVVLEQVVPAYYAALKPAAPLQQRAGRTATLTLVRWPYT